MTEFEKLVKMLDDAKIPYERNDDRITEWTKQYYDSTGNDPMKRIKYPSKERERCSIIFGYGSYGYDKGLLEIQGLLYPSEEKYDSVKGYLTAEDVFKRIKKDHECGSIHPNFDAARNSEAYNAGFHVAYDEEEDIFKPSYDYKTIENKGFALGYLNGIKCRLDDLITEYAEGLDQE